jgi:RHS repeat-associated protein
MKTRLLALVLSLFAGTHLAHAAHVDPAPLPDDVAAKLAAGRHPPRDPLAAALAGKVMEIERLLQTMAVEENAVTKRAGKGAKKKATTQTKPVAIVDRRPMIEAYKSELGVMQSEAHRRIETMRARYRGNAEAGNNLDDLKRKADDRFAELGATLDAVRIAPKAGARAALEKAKATLARLHPAEVMGKSEPTPTFRQDVPPKMKPQKKASDLPRYLSGMRAPGNNVYAFLGDTLLAAVEPEPVPQEATSCDYVQADLDPTPEVVIDDEIRALAESLGHSPAKIWAWMHDNIRFEPYYGSLKGAKGTLVSGAGGPTDQASLMIALLRASNIPARYVKGKISVRDTEHPGAGARAMRWLGAKSEAAAQGILAQGRFPEVAGFGDDTGVKFVHVWVEACVPYAHYRGAALSQAGHRWIPLDPSFRDNTYASDVDVSAVMDYVGYLSELRNGPDSLPHEYYAEQGVKPLLPAGKSLEDLAYKANTSKLKLDVLPSSLPYIVTEFRQWGDGIDVAETAAITDSHRYKLTLTVKNPVGVTLINGHVMSLAEVALKRVTLRYLGADAATLVCGTQVRPAIYVEGQEMLQGSSTVDVCSPNNQLILTVSQGEIAGATDNSVTYYNIGAANYHALLAYAFQTSDRLLNERASRLIDTVRATADPNTNLEETEGEFLHLVGLKYLRYVADAMANAGGLTNGSGQSGHNLGLTSAGTQVEYLFDLPFAVVRSGFLVDMPGLVSRSVDLMTGAPNWDAFLLGGYSGSAYESYIWQENARLDAVSSVRGIQFARESGIDVLTVSSANWATEKSKLTTGSSIYTSSELSNIESSYINQGYTLTIPKQHIQYGDWKGYVFVGEKQGATSFNASFIISGGYAGGYTVGNPIDLYSWDPFSFYGTGFYTGVYAPPPSYTTGSTYDFAPIVFGDGLIGKGSTPATTWAGDPVNLVNGNFYHTERDISIPGRGGLPIVFERHYNSRDAKDGPMGYGWTHSFNHALRFYGVGDGVAKASWTDGTGSEKFFGTSTHVGGDIAAGAVLDNPEGLFIRFERLNDGTGRYRITEKNGLAYTFESVAAPNAAPEAGAEPAARLLEIRDRNGNALTLDYTGNGRSGCATDGKLAKVSDGIGRHIDFCYVGGRIASVFDVSGREFRYVYDAAGNLQEFQNALSIADPAKTPPVRYEYYTPADGANLDHAMKRYTLPRGNGMSFEYYANGRVFRHATFPLAETTTFSYNDFRRETLVIDPRGDTRHHFFDAYGNLVQLVEENGAVRNYGYDPEHPYNRLVKTSPLGLQTQYAYDIQGNVTRITQPSGATVQLFDTTAFNQPRRIQDERGNYTVLRYDAAGNLIDEIRAREGFAPPDCPSAECPIPLAADILAWTHYAYDSFGNRTQTQAVRDFAGGAGPSVEYAHDPDHLYPVAVTRRADRNGDGLIGSDEADSATLSHDSLGRLTFGIDADWRPITADYDAADRVIRASDTLGYLRDYQYDANGNRILEQLIVNGQLIESLAAQYDLADRRELVLDAAGHATRQSFDARGNPLLITDPDGYSLGFDRDPAGRWTRAYDQEGHAVSRDLDLEGKPRGVIDPNGHAVTYDYWGPDYDGRLKRETGPTGRYAEYTYDQSGNLILVQYHADHAGRAVRTWYDALDRPVREVGPEADPVNAPGERPVTCMKYDPLGNLTEIWAGSTQDAVSATCDYNAPELKRQATYVHDDLGRRIRETDPLGHSQTWSYDLHGNVLETTDAENRKTLLTWAPGHQLQSRTLKHADGATERTETHTRNPLGQTTRLEVRDGAGVLILAQDTEYDAAHRIRTETETRPGQPMHTLTYAHSPGGLLNSVTDSANNRWDYLYDGTGRPVGLWAPNFDYLAFTWDAGGRLLERWSSQGASSVYTWNADDSLAALDNLLPDGALMTAHHYGYDAQGRRSQHSETLGALGTKYRQYSHDALDRLTRVQDCDSAYATCGDDEILSYDPLGNRTTRTAGGITQAYLHDAANRLTEIRQNDVNGPLAAAYVWNANGELAQRCTGTSVTRTDSACSGSQSASFHFDTSGRLTQASQGAASESYAYDPQGRRIALTQNGLATGFHHLGANLLSEHDTQGALTAAWVMGGLDAPLVRLTGATNSPDAQATPYWADGLGSVVATGAAPAQTNLAQGRPVTQKSGAAEAGYYQAGIGFNPAVLTDGDRAGHNPSQGGLYAGASGSLFQLDFAGLTRIERIDLYLGQAGGQSLEPQAWMHVGDLNDVPKLTLSYCDNSPPATCTKFTDFTTLPGGTLTGNSGVIVKLALTPIEVRAVRIQLNDGTSNNQASDSRVTLAEIEVYGESANGNAVQRFDAWGNKLEGQGAIERFGYTGREPTGAEVGLIYYRARYYDPAIGRFISRDPAGMVDGVNRYAYVGGDPVDYTDPSGEFALNAAGALAGAGYGFVSGGISGAIVGWKTAKPGTSTLERVGLSILGGGTGAVSGAAVGAAAGAMLNPALAASAPISVASGVAGGLVANIGTTTVTQIAKQQPVQPFNNLTWSSAGNILTSAVVGTAAVSVVTLGAGLVSSTTALAGGVPLTGLGNMGSAIVGGIGAGVGETAAMLLPATSTQSLVNFTQPLPGFEMICVLCGSSHAGPSGW